MKNEHMKPLWSLGEVEVFDADSGAERSLQALEYDGFGIVGWVETTPEGDETLRDLVRRLVGSVNSFDAMREALRAICEFWDFANTEGLSTSLSPDALIGGHKSDAVISIHDVVREALKLADAQGNAADRP